MNENTKEQETESRPEDAQASEQVNAVRRSNYDSKKIHQKFNIFKNIKYRFGWEWGDEHKRGICYGIGWNEMILRTIFIEPDKITYEYRKAEFLGFPAIEKKKEIEYEDNFFIPSNVNEFDRYIES